MSPIPPRASLRCRLRPVLRLLRLLMSPIPPRAVLRCRLRPVPRPSPSVRCSTRPFRPIPGPASRSSSRPLSRPIPAAPSAHARWITSARTSLRGQPSSMRRRIPRPRLRHGLPLHPKTTIGRSNFPKFRASSPSGQAGRWWSFNVVWSGTRTLGVCDLNPAFDSTKACFRAPLRTTFLRTE